MIGGVTDGTLVGRHAELARLEQGIARALDEQPTLTFVFGEAGAGKTTLLRAGLAAAADRGCVVALGACVDGEHDLAFAPLRAALRALVPALGADAVRDLTAGLPAAATLLPPTVRPAASGSTDPADLHHEVLELLGAVAERCPLALAIEDLQWIDRSTLALVSFLVRNLTGERIALLATVRSEDLDPGGPVGRQVAELCRSSIASRVDLAGLPLTDLADLLGIGPDVPAPALEHLWRRTDGNPFFALELHAAGVLDGAPLPDAVRDVVALRLRHLDDDADLVARVAAVAGADVEPETFAHVLGRPILWVETALRAAERVGVLAVDPDTGRVSFRHPLIREVALGRLLGSERRRLHAALADVVARAPEVDHARVAAHLEAAGRTGDAVEAWLAAARQLAASSRTEDAAVRYGRALQLWDEVPDAPARLGAPLVDLLEEAVECCLDTGAFALGVELNERLLDELDPTSEVERWGLAAAHLAELRWEAGDSEAASELLARARVVLAGHERSEAWGRVLERQAFQGAVGGELEDLVALAEQVVALGDELGDTQLRVVGLNRLAVQLAVRGDDRAHALLARAFDEAWSARLGREMVRAAINRVLIVHASGRHEEARRAGEAARAACEDLGAPSSYRSVIDALLARALVTEGAWDRAADLLAAVTLPASPRFAGYVGLARAELAVGRGDLAATHRALDDIRFVGVAVVLIHASVVEARTALLEARIAEGLRLVQDGLRLAAVIAETTVHRLVALGLEAVALLGGDEALADDLLARAVAHHDRLAGMPQGLTVDAAARMAVVRARHAEATDRPAAERWREAAAELRAGGFVVDAAEAEAAWARALVAEGGDRALATRLAAAAHAEAARLGALPLRAQVEDLVRRARLDVPGVHRVAEGDLGLTDREVEVLRLVAEGRSNREVAEALYISPKTASVHVSNILRKVGATSRGEAAALAHRLGLLTGSG